MKERVVARLQQLKTEFDTGQQMLADLDQKRVTLEQTMLRISGAIQVLEELLVADAAADDGWKPPVAHQNE
jgi:hypothetical protein